MQIASNQDINISKDRPKTRRYSVLFADGKGATVLDMEAQPEAEALAGIRSIFREDYVREVKPL